MRALALSLIATALDGALLALALGGVTPLLAHPRALALLAVWAASNAVLASRRPLAGHAAAAVDRDPALVMLALFVLPLLAAPLAAWGERRGVWPVPWRAAFGWIGVALAAAGLALRIAAMTRLGARFSPRVALQHEHVLETRGLYAHVRHPGYLGAWLAALGGALAFHSALGLLPVLLMRVAIEARIRREERLLASRFGDAWRAYRARTGALWPRLGATPPANAPRA